ncbi:pre-mRNA-processing factor SLU7 [Strigomonas culicis]|uniref:Pre-mRNA-splicing factor SLU7 n=1 Tax=Strigomonas culicis TaxID=28005 RepID=S9UE95_9TRYP|nr:pre-mRNA-processing factor SLU7 [Strigomonas culicis]|eukprot:EPY27258.1 pre-mRNA-processing factor SLU7 [Strigomonas culicis]
MTQAPWYYGIDGPTLAHQRGDQEGQQRSDALVYQPEELRDLGKASAYVAGACKNCGSRTHKTSACIYAKRKVGAVFSGVVRGSDWELVGQAGRATAARQIAAFDGDVGVDLMKSVDAERLAGPAAKRPAPSAPEAEVDAKRAKLDLFAGKTAQHGGLEIKEVPKYLQNLELDGSGGGGMYFDPKTGAMRGNPNAQDPTKEFQGDLVRYRSGDYHHYLEGQHRFLTGQSKSFVNFELDAEVGREKALAAQQGLSGGGGGHAAPPAPPAAVRAAVATQEAILQRLYQTGSATAAPRAAPAEAPVRLAPPSVGASGAEAEDPSRRALAAVARLQGEATRSGHLFPFGSYFDTKTFAWGYEVLSKVRPRGAILHRGATVKDTASLDDPG